MKKFFRIILSIVFALTEAVLYFFVSYAVFEAMLPSGRPFVSMKGTAWAFFAFFAFVNYFILILLKKKNHVFAWAFFISAIIINLIVVVLLSGINYYF